MALSTYLANRLLDHTSGKAAYTSPVYFISLSPVRALSGALRSTAVVVGDFTIPATPNGRLYRCTTAGTTGAGEPTWSVVDGGTTADGTATWTEHSPSLRSATNVPEASYTGWARRVTAPADWNSAAAGTGANAATINFGTKTGGVDQMMTHWTAWDALTAGNMLEYGALTSSVLVTNSATPNFAAGQFSRTAT